MTKQSMKRIHAVTIKRMIDESPDTSWLGEYSNKATSEYSIDRTHALDCPINTGRTPLEDKTRTMANADGLNPCECVDAKCKHHSGHAMCHDKATTILYRLDMDDLSGTLMCDECANDATESGVFQEGTDEQLTEVDCTCDEHGDMGRNEYQYFNPANVTIGPPEEVRKQARQDYERMESLNRGDWCFIGVRADADVRIDTGHGHSIIQTVTSGGLWGIESESGDYFKEVEQEQLNELRSQLEAIGFSKRAISAAFRTIEHKAA